MRSRLSQIFIAVSLVAALHGAAATAADSATAWETLRELRTRLVEGSPLTADFVQTFTPAGFSDGDVESGRLALSLPSCARWDYIEPFAKSFLLCGKIAYAWNPGEGSGRRYEVSDDDDEGLDLLRLDVEKLRSRYQAEALSEAESLDIILKPRDDTTLITGATIVLSPDGQQLVAILFEDREGSRTRFELGRLESSDPEFDFSPPASVEWLVD